MRIVLCDDMIYYYYYIGSPPSCFNSIDFIGPLLLVPLSSPSDQSDLNKLSCHAWLLWKPESLCNIGRILLQLQLTKIGGQAII